MNYSNKPILAMIHLHGNQTAVDIALKEIEILHSEGVEGIIIENYHGDIETAIKVLGLIKGIDMQVGINILPNEYHIALPLANEYNAQFIQLDHVAGSYRHGKYITTLDIEEYNQYRKMYPNIEILGGVHPKYYNPISPLEEDLKDGVERADAIVVTGSGTGKVTPYQKIQKFRNEIGDFPLIVGAGVDKDNIVQQLSIADGAIVGSSLKKGSNTTNMIDRDLVKQLMNEKKKL